MPYQKTVSEHLRLTILRLLSEQGDYSLNESLMLDMLHDFAFSCSRDKLKTELSWLAEQGIVEINLAYGLSIVKINSRGVDVATGLTNMPGIKRPAPRD